MTTVAPTRPRRLLGWLLPLALVLLVFAIPPVVGGRAVSGTGVPAVIREVLAAPLAYSVAGVLPVAKLALLAAAIVGIAGVRHAGRVVLGYYAVVLLAVAVFQNAAQLPGGLAVITGNLVGQVVVAAICLAGLRGVADGAPLRRERLWLLPFMAWAWLFPYAAAGGEVVPGGWTGVLTNGAGLTYCMITPVVAGVLALRPDAYPRLVRSAVGWLGLLFGLLNVVMWFGLNRASWWMGVLHVPLVVVSAALLVFSRRESNG